MVNLGEGWNNLLKEDFASLNYKSLREFLKYEYSHYTIYPDMYNIFNSMVKTPLEKVKVVLIGQDPYHNPGQAMGLSFSVPKGVELPPSLKNIYKEIKDDIGITEPLSGDLTKWAEQGVLLLNSVLTVRRGAAFSHAGKGWEVITDSIIKKVSEVKNNLVFLLWGAPARAKKKLIKGDHLILECAHPSPLSAYNGFFGCKHFSKTNDYLIKKGKTPINWDLN